MRKERTTTMRILVVEDDKKIAAYLAKGLREAGFTVDVAHDGWDGLHLACSEPYDASVVDIMIPRLDGLALIERLRQSGVVMPVLILSAKHSVDDRVRGLQAGGDDYLVKPFSFAELLARVHALIRRATPTSPRTTLTAGDLRMNLLTREVSRGNQRIELQPREFALLEYMMRHSGQVLTKTLILEKVWDYNFDPQTNVVDVLVCRLRNKIDRGFPTEMIHTVRGVGYVLRTDTPES